VTEFFHTEIETRYSENLKIQEFADKYFFSREYLSRLFKNRYGIGIYEYLTKVCMDRAKSLLADPEVGISDIAVRIGFSDAGYFSKAFRAYTGQTPSEYRREHAPQKDS
jgi:two-component system response regulator YesN